MNARRAIRGPEGLLGFRAVAGLRTTDGRVVADGTLYRSATPHFVDRAEAGRFVAESGLRTIVDLRLGQEVRNEGSGGFTDSDVAIVNVPFAIRRTLDPDSAVAPMPGPDPLVGTYLNYLSDRDGFARLIAALSAPDALPALIHCTVGKDRTGVAYAVLLDAVGVLRSDICANYARQSEDVAAMMGRLRAMASYGDAVDVYPEQAYRADPAVLLRFLGWLDHLHGGSRAYLLACGVAESELDALAEMILRPAGETTPAQVSRTAVVPAPVERTWAVAGDVGAVHRWVPAIADCSVAGDVRTATFADGGRATERIDHHDDPGRSYAYTYLDGPIPMDSYTSTLTVGPRPDGSGSIVVWNATLQAEPGVVAAIVGLYEASLAELAVVLGESAQLR